MSDKTPDSIRYQEEDVKHGISAWLIENGIDVWWEKKNSYGYDIFSTTTGAKKPDLLIKWKDNVVLVEVKTPNHIVMYMTRFSNCSDIITIYRQ